MDIMLNLNSIINRVYGELIWADKVYKRAGPSITKHNIFGKILKLRRLWEKQEDLSRYLQRRVYYFDANYLLIYN